MIETVITPKEGFKLSVRGSKGSQQEEYLVESVEVVSFGRSHFFRSLEKPKPFLVPVTDYEVVELREARMVLKGAGFEKSIKIGGGKESQKEPSEEKVLSPVGEEILPQEKSEPAPQQQPYQEKKRGKRYRRKGHHSREEAFNAQSQSQEGNHVAGESSPEEKKEPVEAAPVVIRKLIPPPSTLIKEKLARIKGALDEELFPAKEVNFSEGEVRKVEEKVENKEPEEEFPPFNQDQID
jgi:hypothetical protein